MYLKRFLEYINEVKGGTQNSLHKHTHLVIEKHVDCKWIDAEREMVTTNDRKKEDNKQTNHLNHL